MTSLSVGCYTKISTLATISCFNIRYIDPFFLGGGGGGGGREGGGRGGGLGQNMESTCIISCSLLI